VNITPNQVAACYEMLRAFPPFSKWKLPEAESVAFHTRQLRNCHGVYQWDGKTHNITISTALVDSHASLVDTVAHEMIHLYQELRGTVTKTMHNPEFHQLSRRVCNLFMYDKKRFIG